jgi:hypothetical protein
MYRFKIRQRFCAGRAGVSSKLARHVDVLGRDPSPKYLMLSLLKNECLLFVLALRQAQDLIELFLSRRVFCRMQAGDCGF